MYGDCKKAPADCTRLRTCKFQSNKVIINQTVYDPETGKFLGLRETLGFVNIKGDSDKVFLNYEYLEENKSFGYY